MDLINNWLNLSFWGFALKQGENLLSFCGEWSILFVSSLLFYHSTNRRLTIIVVFKIRRILLLALGN
jgi:hypothetical protein